ncbi:hypothetical protein [Actinoplanes aureus]|uniref:Uncharacterized protein n=1 Tax=Actinoplanes aureus TaxID=2792083 RepID=A0A931FZN4_9ACTN|nr:hypothetical protein [Actinoplanes aureus]MBG0564960.1 hypothetical protein [Actinoplanes aureus]
MTKPSDRGVPVRGDMWRPEDEVLDSAIRKSIDEAHRGAPGTGGSPVLVAGALVVMAFAVVVAAGTGNPMLALTVAVLAAVAGLAYIGLKAAPLRVDRLQILSIIGGPGNLPAGYVVHPLAWQAGMQEYMAPISDRYLRAAVRLCRDYPGSVSDLLRLIRRAEKHFINHHDGREPTDAELAKVATRMMAPALT